MDQKWEKIEWHNNDYPALNEHNLNLLSNAITEAINKSNSAASSITEINGTINKWAQILDHLCYKNDDDHFVVSESGIGKLNIYALIEAFGDTQISDGKLSYLPDMFIGESTEDSKLATIGEVNSKVDSIVPKTLNQFGQKTGADNILVEFTTTDRVILFVEASNGTTIDVSKITVKDNNNSILSSIQDSTDEVKTYLIEVNRVSSEANQFFITESLFNDKGYAFREIKRVVSTTSTGISGVTINNTDISKEMLCQYVAESYVNEGSYSVDQFRVSTFKFPENS